MYRVRLLRSYSISTLLACCLILAFYHSASLQEIALPLEMKARAIVLKSERDGLWEKALVLTFEEARKVLSTNDGLINARAVVNHSAHPQIWRDHCEKKRTSLKVGGKIYMEEVREKIASLFKVNRDQIALVATAVDMDNLAVVTKHSGPYTVTALVTAGARTNALRAGYESGSYTEGEKEGGTVNIILLTNVELTKPAMARAIITITEAQTSAFQDLKI